ncbi:hypothetical protein GCM10027578_39870 [Spirosoma luteolum]
MAPFATLFFRFRCVVFPVALLLTLLVQRGRAQSPMDYSMLPHQTIDPAAPDDFSLFDSAFYQNQLFLLGESHGVQQPQRLDLALLKHLNQRTGLRHYLAEVDATQAHYLNTYLQTGNEGPLDRVFQFWRGQKAQWGNRDFRQKIQAIRAYNQTRPRARRIRFVGIDRLQDYPLTAEYLTRLLDHRPLPAAARPLADTLLQQLRTNRPDSLIGTTALAWLRQIETAPRAYSRAFGQSADTLRHLLTNAGYLKTIPGREATLFANFSQLLPGLGQEKLYGLWGFFHVLQTKPLTSGKPLACRIRESDLYLHDRVVSIVFSYLDSYTMLPSSYLPLSMRDGNNPFSPVSQFNNDGAFLHTEGIETMRAVTVPHTATLFALDRPGSPARQTPLRITYGPMMPRSQQIQFDPARPITASFQYVWLVRDSPMTQPLPDGH